MLNTKVVDKKNVSKFFDIYFLTPSGPARLEEKVLGMNR